MTQRERLLSIIVGGLLIAVAFQWAFSKYRDALRFRQNRLFSLSNQVDDLQSRWLEGARAEGQMGEYKIRSVV